MFGGSKSTFGSGSAASNFGNFGSGSNVAPFAQPTFAKPTFGASNSFVTQNSAPSMFASNSTQPSGLFGGPGTANTFGTTTTATSFKGFSQSGQSNSLFGSALNTNSPSSLFGQSASSAFGSTGKPSLSNFAQPAPLQSGSSLFGHPPPLTNSSAFGSFGQTNSASLNAFGGCASSAFGQNSTLSNSNLGTSGTKYQWTVGTDTLVKGGQPTTISTKLHCITAMKEYETKSLEELRYEDICAGRKSVQTNSSSAGFFNSGNTNSQANTNNVLFGATTPASNCIFGSPATTTENKVMFSQNSFGQLPNSNSFATPAPGNFQSKQFGSINSTGFVAGNTDVPNPFVSKSSFVQTTTSGLFGKSSACPPSTFGQPSSSFNSFVTTSCAQTPTLFGTSSVTDSNKPTFGLPANTSNSSGCAAFGVAAPCNSGLFAGKPNSAFALNTFGINSTTNTGYGNFPLGNSVSTNSSFFACNPNKSFGAGVMSPSAQVSFSSGNPSNGMFSMVSKPGGIFGSSGNTNLNTGPLYFGASNNISTTDVSCNKAGTTFGGSLGASCNFSSENRELFPIHKQIMSKVTSPYGDTAIFKDLIKNDADASCATDSSSQQAIIDVSNKLFRVDSKPATSAIKTKPLQTSVTKKVLFEGLEEYDSSIESFNIKPSAKRLIIKSKPIDNKDLCTEDNPAPSPGTNRNSYNDVNSTNINSYFQHEISERRYDDSQKESWLHPNDFMKARLDRVKLETNRSNMFHNSTVDELVPRKNPVNYNQNDQHSHLAVVETQAELKNKSESGSTLNCKEFLRITEISPLEELQKEIHPTGVILNRAGYYIIPSLDELLQYLTADNNCIVPNFTIGRKGYGNVFFSKEIDVAGLNLDEIVHFRNKEVIIYPDDESKPVVGEGLNREAQVTLDQVWPHDKTNHKAINDPKRLAEMDWEGKLRRVCAKNDTRFVEYRPETGSWVFLVKHFSKYGLSDSDEEEDALTAPNKIELMNIAQAEHLKKNKIMHSESECSPTFMHLNNISLPQKGLSKFDVMKETLFTKDNSQTTFSEVEELECNFYANFKLISNNQFPKNEFKDSSLLDVRTSLQCHQDLLMHQVASSNSLLSGFQEFQSEVLSAEENEKFGNDSSLALRFSFKFAWHPRISSIAKPLPIRTPMADSFANYGVTDNIFVKSISTKIGFKKKWNLSALSCTENFNSLTYNGLQMDKLEKTDNNEYPLKAILTHIKIEKDACYIKKTGNGCPFVRPKARIEIIGNHLSVAENSMSKTISNQYNTSVWSLLNVLWGHSNTFRQQEASTYAHAIFRRQLFSSWLQQNNTANDDFPMQITKENYLTYIYFLLLRHNVTGACDVALKYHDLNMALLISQIPSISVVRSLINAQLKEWQQNSSDKYISKQRLIVYMLIAGQATGSFNGDLISSVHKLNWLKSISIFFWYLGDSNSSITDILCAYEKLSKSEGTQSYPPLPPYLRAEVKLNPVNLIYDMRYHLLNLYCKRSYPLEVLLMPTTHTRNHLDYSLSWLVLQCLEALGYAHCSSRYVNQIHTRFANQLEESGLWEWSLFVLLHIKDASQREAIVQDTLYRCVDITDNITLSEKEEFIVNELRLPESWIYNAKSARAKAIGRYMLQVLYLLKAQRWSLAHEILYNHVAPNDLIKENLNLLHYALVQLDNCTIVLNWSNKGKILLKFIEISKKIATNTFRNEHIGSNWKSIRTDIFDICSRINNLPCSTSYHQISQNHLAKYIERILRHLYKTCNAEFQCDDELYNATLQNLPLPIESSRC